MLLLQSTKKKCIQKFSNKKTHKYRNNQDFIKFVYARKKTLMKHKLK